VEEIYKDLIITFVSDDMEEFNKTPGAEQNSLWKIESLSISESGPIIWKKKYRLRHNRTGKYLAARKNSASV